MELPVAFFFPFFQPPTFVLFCLSTTVCKALRSFAESYFAFTFIPSGRCTGPSKMTDAVAAPRAAPACFSVEPMAKPYPTPCATRRCQQGTAVVCTEKCLCQQAT